MKLVLISREEFAAIGHFIMKEHALPPQFGLNDSKLQALKRIFDKFVEAKHTPETCEHYNWEIRETDPLGKVHCFDCDSVVPLSSRLVTQAIEAALSTSQK